MQNRLALVLFACVVTPLLACGTAKKTNECSVLIQRINAAERESSALHATIDKQAPKPEPMERTAAVFEQLEQDLGAMDISTDELRGYRDEYRQLTQRAGQAMRRTAQAIRDNDHEALSAAMNESQATKQPEAVLTEKINQFCRPQ